MAMDGDHIEKAHRTHLTTERTSDLCTGSGHNLGGTASDINDTAQPLMPVGCSEEGEGSFFLTGYDLQCFTGQCTDQINENITVCRVPGGTCGKKTDFFGTAGPGFSDHQRRGTCGTVHTFFTETVVFIQPGKQACTFTVTHDPVNPAVCDFCQKHSDRIGTDSDHCCTHGQSSSVL